MDFNHYFTNEELETVLKSWADEFPTLIKLEAIGASHKGQSIWLLTITNFSTGPDLEKPAVWMDGNIHATELAGTTTVLYILHHILEQYGKDEQITHLLDTSTFYAVPRINPDGAGAAMAKNPRFVRSGVRPYPWEELDEGLHVQDIDGDSRILQMRIPDPNGDWKPWEQDKRYMVKREPADFGGDYYRLLPEGLIENYDGYIIDIARPAAGLDFNRNFPFEWRPESDQRGAGPYPASEPEINAVVSFLSQHVNINFALTFHTFSRVLLRPFSTKPDEQMDAGDLYVYKLLGEIGTRLTGYRNVSTYHDFINGPKDITTGAFDDWVYDQFGAFVFTVELWDLPTEAGVIERKFVDWFNKHPLEDDIMILKWSDDNVGPDGYVAWYPFEHPQLGRVELGGWNTLYTWRNPPLAFMCQEAQRHLPYALTMASLLPHLTLHRLDVKKISEKNWAIDLVVENTGYLPTFTSQQARRRKAARPVIAELSLPKAPEMEPCRILLGKERMEIGHLEGRSNKDEVSSVFGSSPTDNRGHIQWVVEAPAGCQVEVIVRSERAGQFRRSFILE
jgi:murein tripeptide amidase MpaA